MNSSHDRNHQGEIWLNRPTSDHFARVVADLAELAPNWQTAVRAAVRPAESIQFLVFVPFQGRLGPNRRKTRPFFQSSLLWEFTPDWLIVLTERRLIWVCSVESGTMLQTTPIDLESILEIQCGTVLLFAWFNLQWGEGGLVRQGSILFNAVGEPIFTRLIALMRCRMDPTPGYGKISEERSPNLLQALPYKFMNIIPKRGLLAGEPVQKVVYRPARWKRRFGFFRRMSAAQAVVLLTPGAVLVAEEDCAAGQSHYGFIHTLYPLGSIRRAWTTRSEGVSRLSIALESQGASLVKQLDFGPEALETLAAFADQIISGIK